VVVDAALLLNRVSASTLVCVMVAATLEVLDIETVIDNNNIRANPESGPYRRRLAWCCIVVTISIQYTTTVAL
jgi:hypothetical protein